MDLSTSYMGVSLSNPLIVGSSGLTQTAENIRKCAIAGAGAVVLKSLFEEQFIADKNKLQDQDDMYFWHPEAVEQIGSVSREHGTDAYLHLIEDSKKIAGIPVFASLNCVTASEWPAFAKKIENANHL